MKAAVQAFIRDGGNFEDVALELHRWQRANNPQYDRFCGETIATDWMSIPAVPTALFRDLSFTCFDAAEASVVFQTSGTTTGKRGQIRLQDVDVYRQASRAHAERCLGALPLHGVSFVPTGADSSLGHMCADFVPGMPNFFDPERGVDANKGWDAIRRLAAEGSPLFVPGTAFALADLLDAEEPAIEVPIGSIVMVTGGFKGRRRSVPSGVLHQRLAERLIGARIVGEYGMSELASQLWSVPVSAPFVPPHWMRVLAVDPWSGEPTDRGLLRFFDLANHQTVLAIETADVGTVHADGSVTLEGRLEGSIPRGCSLTVEEANA